MGLGVLLEFFCNSMAFSAVYWHQNFEKAVNNSLKFALQEKKMVS